MGLLLPRGHCKTRLVSPKTGRHSAFEFMLGANALSVSRDLECQTGMLLDASGSRDVADALQMARFLAEQLAAGSRVLVCQSAARSWFEPLTSSIEQGVEAQACHMPASGVDGPEASRWMARAEDYMRWNLTDIATTVDVARELGILAKRPRRLAYVG